jgi:hypothetical protein
MKAKNFQEVENENPLYFGVERYDAIESKKDILSSEMSFLNIIKIARRYHSLRVEELEIRIRMYRAIKELDAAIKKTKASFPFFKIPEKIKKEEIKKEEPKIIKKDFDESLELELRSIQEKLKSISRY